MVRAREDRDYRVESSRKIRELESNVAVVKSAEEDARKQVEVMKVNNILYLNFSVFIMHYE